ncbi:MAG: DUF3365 domain-containing protein [Chloroflexi bacterium]|nr:DUF3365 domain-containing protein [Chloroflexota bacterium]
MGFKALIARTGQRASLWILLGAWTVCVAASLIWNIHQEQVAIDELAYMRADLAIEKDMLYRRWASKMGGLYVAISDGVDPNPYLVAAHRDITTTSGTRLTLVNPAYMTRQVNELARSEGLNYGHITSLRPTRPETMPDAWERAALLAFEEGAPEVHSVEFMDGAYYFRLMRPFTVEEGCLTCHAAQGYQLGDIRGGVSTAVSMDPLYAIERRVRAQLTLGHGLIWTIGVAGIWAAVGRLWRQMEQITESEEEARRERDRAQSYLDVAGVILLALNTDGSVALVNRKGCQILGDPEYRILGQDWFSRYVPEPIRNDAKTMFRQILSGSLESSEYVESPILTRHGQERLIAWRTSLVKDDSGALVGTLSSGEDITETRLVEAERERLAARLIAQAREVQRIIDAVPETVLLLDEAGHVQLANPAAERDLPLLIETVPGPGSLDVGADDRVTSHRVTVITHLAGRPLNELLAPAENGLWHELHAGERIFEVSAHSVPDVPGSRRWAVLIHDATREREMRAQMRQQERLATVGQLAAGIAHDFNNTLAIIRLHVQMMGWSAHLSTRDREGLAVIDEQISHAARLIQQMLDFGGRAMLERRPLDLEPLLAEQVRQLGRALPDGIRIELLRGPGDVTVLADSARMQQLVQNLSLNARDAMPDGGSLLIRLARIEQDEIDCTVCGHVKGGPWVEIAISDTGTGMTPEVRSHLFEPFFTTKGPAERTGLGLAQVYGIVKQHEGHIQVDTQAGRGTTISIYLPVLDERTHAVADALPSNISEEEGNLKPE